MEVINKYQYLKITIATLLFLIYFIANVEQGKRKSIKILIAPVVSQLMWGLNGVDLLECKTVNFTGLTADNLLLSVVWNILSSCTGYTQVSNMAGTWPG